MTAAPGRIRETNQQSGEVGTSGSFFANGVWMLVLYGVGLVGLFGFIIYTSVAKDIEARRAYIALAAPIETALNDTYAENIVYTRDYGRATPTSRLYTYTETLIVDGIQRTDCALSFREISADKVADVTLSCAIKPVTEEPVDEEPGRG